MRGASACGAARIRAAKRHSNNAPISSPPWKPAGSRRWRWWARDLKALGLYQARALSYDGVEVELLEHPLTPEQRRIYDAYAGAFKVIHRNIEDALKATGIVEGDATLNKNAKSAALSAFEGAKQRFFGHLLTAMKCPSLIRSIEADLEAGHACVIQLVSTGEALLDRRIADIPVSEWDDISVD